MSILHRPSLQRASICSRCVGRSRRLFSATHRAQNSPPSPPPAGYTHLSNRKVVSVSGIDAPKFLQGLSTNNVDPARDDGWYTAFLNAQGRVLWDAFVYPTLDSDGRQYLVEVDASEVKGLMAHFKRHKLRSKIQIKDLSQASTIWASWGYDEPEATRSSSVEPSIGKCLRLPDPRLKGFLTRTLVLDYEVSGSSDSNQLPPEGFTAPETSLSSYQIHRYLHGVPEGPQEIIPQTALPLESNIDHLNGIDFRKGCYLGQELTIRTQHTGVVRKRILPVQLYTESSVPDTLQYLPDIPLVLPPSGADIKAEGGKRPAGKWLGGVGNIGLALCRLENMTDMRVSAEGGTYQDGMEFRVGSDGLKVKAFVPMWLREKEKTKSERRNASGLEREV
jgi:folate-binding protein YgfZ